MFYFQPNENLSPAFANTKPLINDISELVGWSSFYIEDDNLWLSLGLRPDLTGQGLGKEFVTECVEFAKIHYTKDIHNVRLEVALFNQRAIKVYEKAGFVKSNRISKHTHIGNLDFLQMEKRFNN